MTWLDTLSIIVVLVTATANVSIALADIAKAPFVLATSAEVHLPPRWLPYLAAAKAAGAVGLILGYAGLDAIAIVAGLGLVAFYTGAIAAHVRAKVFYNIMFPGTFLAMAVGSLAVVTANAG